MSHSKQKKIIAVRRPGPQMKASAKMKQPPQPLLPSSRYMEIRAGDITRHPRCQRKSPVQRWLKRFGPFDLEKVLNPIHVVLGGPKGYEAVDGATRVEACIASPDYGPDTKLWCKVYGNGVTPTDAELAEIFLIINDYVTSVSAGVRFQQAVIAGHSDALVAVAQIKRMGTAFRTTTTVFTLVQRFGEESVKRAVDFCLSTWGTSKHIPGDVLAAVVEIHAGTHLRSVQRMLGNRHRGDLNVARLQRRASALRKKLPDTILLGAKVDLLGSRGQRSSLRTHIAVRLLIGRAPGNGGNNFAAELE